MPIRLPHRRLALRLAAALLLVGVVAPHVWAWQQLRTAKAELDRFHPEAARQSLTRCEAVWSEAPGVRLLASRAARQAGDFDEADRELRACQRLNGGTSDEIAFEWALLQAAAGNVREVEEFLKKRADHSPTAAPLVWEAMTEGYLRIYRTLDAMAMVNYWLDREPGNVRALELRGLTYITGKGVQRGSDDLKRVLELDPARTLTRRRLVRALLDLGSYTDALVHIEWLSKSIPDDPELTAQLARCLNMIQGRRADAVRVVEEALARHPDHGLLLRTRGQLALADQQPAEGERYFRRAADVLRDDYQAQWLLYQSLQQQGKVDEAKVQLARAEAVKDRSERLGELRSRKLAEQPLDPALHLEMGTLLLRTGHPEAGEQWLLSALSLDPGYQAAHAALADFYAQKGDAARAADHRRQAGE